ncbi:MAG: cation:proton antiporter [Phycisphaerales bacterium]|nr:cation:proton antiporter [Phycisphaerales bacterium]
MSGPTATLALSIGLGAGVSLLCQRARIPGLLPLMGVGVLAGPSVLGIVDPEPLAGAMRGMVAVVVGLLVYEGALHLDRDSIAQAPRATRGLLTIGALVSWLGCGFLGWWLLGLSPGIAALLGAILIVTGPTVVVPILRRVRLTKGVHSALLAEAILIDPIGVIATVVTLEVVSTGRELALSAASGDLAGDYALPFVAGLVVAVPLALLTVWLSRRPAWRGRAGDEGVVTLCLASCLLGAGLAELLRHEASLVATAVMGLVMARGLGRRTAMVRHAMENIAVPLVGTLFVLLASRFELGRLREVGWREWVFVGAVLIIVRPLCVALSTWRSPLSIRERTYMALMGPRGIVAVSSAALVAETVRSAGHGGLAEAAARAELIVLLLVVVSVAWSSTFAGPLAGLLRVRAPDESKVLLVGIHRLSTALAEQLSARHVPVVLADANAERVRLATQQGLRAVHIDATDESELEQRVLDPSLACVLALTGNEAVDTTAARWGAAVIRRGQARAWVEEHHAPLAALVGLAEDEARVASPLGAVLHGLAIGELAVSSAPHPQPGSIPLMWIHQGRPLVHAPGKPGVDTVCIVLAEAAPGGSGGGEESDLNRSTGVNSP